MMFSVHVLNELQRGSKSTQILDDKQTSTMIRDKWINELGYYNQIGVGRKKNFETSVTENRKIKIL